MRDYIAYAAAGDDADEAGDHEAVVQQVLADVRCARAVEADACEVRRVGRQEEVAVARRDEGQDQHGINADVERHGHDDGDRRRLRVHELRREEGDDGIRPRIRLHGRAEEILENRHVRAKIRIRHPRDAVDGEQRDHARAEDLAVADFFRLHLAENEDGGGDQEHDHLDDLGHVDRLHLAELVGKMRQQVGIVAKDGDDEDSEEEDEHRMVIRARQFLPLQALRFAVDVLLVLRILDELLKRLVLFQILAAVIAPERRADDARQRRRDRHAEHLQHRDVVPRLRHKGDDGNDRDGNGRAAYSHLRRDGRNRHGALGADALLDRHVVDDGEHRVDDMPRAAEHRQKPRRDGCEDRDLLRVVAQELLRVLEHDRESARSLQKARACNDRKDRQHDGDRRHARLIAEDEGVDGKSDAADDGKPDAAVMHAKEQTAEHYEKTENHFHKDSS